MLDNLILDRTVQDAVQSEIMIKNKEGELYMSKVYIEVLDGAVQNVYTDSKEDMEIVVCDHDDEASEKEYGEFDAASEACQELRENKERLRHIF